MLQMGFHLKIPYSHPRHTKDELGSTREKSIKAKVIKVLLDVTDLYTRLNPKAVITAVSFLALMTIPWILSYADEQQFASAALVRRSSLVCLYLMRAAGCMIRVLSLGVLADNHLMLLKICRS